MATKQAESPVPKAKAARKEPAEAKVSHSFTIDCSKPVEDKVFNTSNFAEFLRGRIKIGGRTGHLGESVRVASDDKRISVRAEVAFSKRYLKYLTKKYLKKHSLREFLYVVASNKASYQIKYFNIQQDAPEQE
jgi:large subunit ribosomal protein L22e